MLRAVIVSLLTVFSASLFSAEPLSVGFGSTDITPDLDSGKAVWIAGYGQNRKAIGVHDKLYARALVFKTPSKKIAMVIVDLVGLQYPNVVQIRDKIDGYDYVLVASTHQHEGPDVIGQWGESIAKSGVDPEYLKLVVERVAQAVAKADDNLQPVTARYGTANNEEILRDSRIPHVKDGVIRTLEFIRESDKKPHAILVQQNCHPEALTSRNQYLTADFPYFAIKLLEEKYNCPVAMFSGAVGGLMTIPGTIKDDQGNEYKDGNFEYAEVYGTKLAKSTGQAIDSGESVELTPIQVGVQPVAVPIANPLFKMASRAGLIARDAYLYTDDPFADELKVYNPRENPLDTPACKSEVAYIRLGDVHVACIPGEAYPESLYGKFPDPAEANVDFPDATVETPVVEILPGDKFLFIGLANDELGYIVPKRQWDLKPPFAYGRKSAQYGEVNSCGPEVAPILYEALERAVKQAK